MRPLPHSIKLARAVSATLFLALSSFLVAHRLLAWSRLAFPTLPAAAVLVPYIALVIAAAYAFSRIRTRAPYGLKAFGTYGMCVYTALFSALVLAVLLPLPTGYEALLTLILAAVYLIYGLHHAGIFHLRRYDVPLLAESFSLILVSDLHLGAVSSERKLTRLVEQINAQQGDLILIAGDLFDNLFPSIEDPEAVFGALRSLRAKHGVYACLGNHDAGESADDMLAFAASCGITVLQEEYRIIDGKLTLLGRLDAKPHGGYSGKARQDTASLLSKNPAPQVPLLVLDHNPAAAGEYDSSVDLVLCGHTHNGQLFPANLILKAIYPCPHGCYRKTPESSYVIVTSGAGCWGMPMRVGSDCEIVRIELKRERQ